MFGFVISLANLFIQAGSVVHPEYFDIYWVNVPGVFGLPISLYYLIKSPSKKNKDYIIMNQALDMADIYNQRLLKDINSN